MSDAKGTEEPSIEEILGSIRRIIADDETGAENAAPAPAAVMPDIEEEDEPLELTQKIDTDGTILDMQDDEPFDNRAFDRNETFVSQDIAMVDSSYQQISETLAASTAETLVSQNAAAATAAVMAKLARNTSVTKPGNEGQTIEDMVKDLLRPMLREWLDQHLPHMVQAMVERELERIARRVV